MTAARRLLVSAAALACLLAVAGAFPQVYQPVYEVEEPYGRRPEIQPEIEPRQSYGGKADGRVKIQVYRAPNKEKIGYDYFAPWGYYVTQPEDDKPYGYH